MRQQCYTAHHHQDPIITIDHRLAMVSRVLPPSFVLLALFLVAAAETFAPLPQPKLAWSQPLGVGLASHTPSISIDDGLILVPTMTNKDWNREFYLVAHSLETGAVEWTRQLNRSQCGVCAEPLQGAQPALQDRFVRR